MGVKMNSKIITENHESDPEIEFLKKSILKSYGRATARPQASELILNNSSNFKKILLVPKVHFYLNLSLIFRKKY